MAVAPVRARRGPRSSCVRPSPTAPTAPRGRGCPARRGRGPTRSQPRRAGSRQSTPITSPPGVRMRCEQLPGPDAEVDRGTPRSASSSNSCRMCGAPIARYVVADRARPPTSRTPAAPARRPRPARGGAARRSPTSAPISASQVDGLAEHQRLRALVRPRRPALDQVARQRERRAREPDQRAPPVPCAGGGSPRAPRARRLLGLERSEPRDVGERRGSASSTTGPSPGSIRTVDAHRRERHHDVAEQDRGVERPSAGAAAW